MKKLIRWFNPIEAWGEINHDKVLLLVVIIIGLAFSVEIIINIVKLFATMSGETPTP